ncbi:MAG: DUF167 domain-containing protein [Deltaproteobacteria bacterium]|nr:DUF167 domain-containing protein [Deltaproteobacteria bacterium]
MSSFFLPTCQGFRLLLLVSPGARRTQVVGLQGDRLKVRVAAAPEKGAANQELLAFLAERLQVPRNALRLALGAQSRAKVVEVQGLEPELRERLEKLAKPAS